MSIWFAIDLVAGLLLLACFCYLQAEKIKTLQAQLDDYQKYMVNWNDEVKSDWRFPDE